MKRLVHVDGDSAVSSKRTIKRYEYAQYPIGGVTIETAGTIDMDVELKFTMADHRFSIDVRKDNLEALKDIYKALHSIGKLQHKPLRDRQTRRGVERHGTREKLAQFVAPPSSVRGHVKRAIVGDEQYADVVTAEHALTALEDHFEHGLRIGDRAADRSEHLPRCFLLLERLLGLVEQARVLDRHRRLLRKPAEKFELGLVEHATAGAPDGERSLDARSGKQWRNHQSLARGRCRTARRHPARPACRPVAPSP
jgi:hypothetical protein